MRRSLLDLAGDAPRVRPAVLAKGFRPFFLLAAAWGALAMPIWLLVLAGRAGTGGYLVGPFWHAHEMIFGFTVAVIAGFLLTAVANWTERETAVGRPLAALAGLWLVGRLAVAVGDRLPPGVPAAADLVFLPALAAACARPIAATRNRRNYQFVAMLAALFAANTAMHLGATGVAPAWLGAGGWLAVDVIVVMIVVTTARIVPLFTRNATGVEGIRNLPRLDALAAGATAAVAVLDAAAARPAADLVAGLAGAAVAARALPWGARHTLRHPLLWVLHAGHAWIALGLVLRAVGHVVPAVPPTVALHALTAGGIGMLTLGMMARVALGHTGRLLATPPAVAVAFQLMLAAAVVRVGGPLLGVAAWLPSMLMAGTLFALAFAIYLAVYTPMLLAARPDGRPG